MHRALSVPRRLAANTRARDCAPPEPSQYMSSALACLFEGGKEGWIMAAFVRRDVWSFADPWDNTIKWYEKAVEALSKLPITNPLSWQSLGAMHGIVPA